MPCGRPYLDPGFAAYGPEGEDRTDKVSVKGSVRCAFAGDYELQYLLLDGREVLAEAKRIVHVVPAELPETVPTSKTIYLTFDDGPKQYTEQVLDILAKYNVKATFFIVAGNPKYRDLLPRIVEEGHTLGIHCYTHVYEDIYKSPQAFADDFMKAQDIIYTYTGQYAQVSRLPGGSVTASYLAGKFPDGYEGMRQMIHNMGIRYYDWDIQPESGRTAQGTLYNFTHPDEPYDSVIVLQHDTRLYSVNALEGMIQWGLENGYSFAPIDQTTPEVHFR